MENYRVTKSGKIYNKITGKRLKTRINSGNYESIIIKGKSYLVHRLVAQKYLPNPNNYPFVNHEDGNRLNNHVSNLRWCTAKQNSFHANNVLKVKKHCRAVCQFSKDGKFIKEYKSLTEAQNCCGITKKDIHKACNGKRVCVGGSYWKYKEESETPIRKAKNIHPVAQYDIKSGELLRIFESAAAAEKKYNLTHDTVCKACRGETKSAGGFAWKYVKKEINKSKSTHMSKKVAQYNAKTKELIKIFDGAVDAAKAVGVTRCNINRACFGKRKTCAGYIWKYVEEKVKSLRVAQYDVKTKKLIREYKNAEEAAKILGVHKKSINKACSGNAKTCAGYEWRYVDIEKKEKPKEKIDIDGKEIKGYEKYLVTKCGKIYSIRSHRYLKQTSDFKGYKFVGLSKNGKSKLFAVHRLIAATYLENPNNCPVVNHIDGNPSNNNVKNLEWCSHSWNSIHSVNMRLEKLGKEPRSKEKTGKSKNQREFVRKVIQYDFDGNKIATYKSISNANKAVGFDSNNSDISAVCGKKPGCLSAAGYIWRYDDDELTEEELDKFLKAKRKGKRRVVCYDTEGNQLAIYETMTIAAHAVGLKKGDSVGDVCKGKRTIAAGYVWRFEGDKF